MDGEVIHAEQLSDGTLIKVQDEKFEKAVVPSGLPTDHRGLVFETQRQRTAAFIQKGITKPGRVSFDVLRRASISVHIARICVNTLKEKITKTEWVIKPIDPLAKVDEAKVERVTNLFKYPNNNSETFRTLLDKMLEDLLVLDEVCIEKTRYPNGELAELFYVDAATIRPVFDEHGEQDIEIPLKSQGNETKVLPVSYVQVLDNSKYGGPESGDIVAAWPKKDFIRFQQHPQGDMANVGYGLSPLEGVLSVVANILNADNFNGTYFEEGSFPPVILQLVGQTDRREMEAYREYLYSELLGNFHRPAIMAGAQKAEVLNLKNLTNNDMQFMQYMQFLARLLAAAYGLSGQDIGLTDDVGSKNVSETQKDLSEAKGYMSILMLIKDTFNREIIWRDLGFEDIEFDWVIEDTTDPDVASKIYDLALHNGTMTLNEVRQKIGLPPLGDWADKPAILGSDGYIPLDPKDKEETMGQDKIAGEDKYGDVRTEDIETNEITDMDKEISKSIYTPNGYKTYFDDRGYGQPFIYQNILAGTGFVIKPPVAVNVYSQREEERLSHEIAGRGVNVPIVTRTTYADVVSTVLDNDEVRLEFDKYTNMTPEYDSEKWRAKFGGSRKFPSYQVSPFIEGFNLKNQLLLDDMRRDPDSYKQAVLDLAALWKVEKEMVLGDRRADQYLITPEKRAWGIDYQFAGDKKRWESNKDAIRNVLEQIPELLELFEKTINSKGEKIKTASIKNSKRTKK